MVGILVVSHSGDAAKGIADIARGMSGAEGTVVVEHTGGNDGGGLGVSVGKIMNALSGILPKCDGVLIVPDLGSSILSSRSAIEMLPPGDAEKVLIADAPILEGAMLAAVEAAAGSDTQMVADAAREAWELKKSEH